MLAEYLRSCCAIFEYSASTYRSNRYQVSMRLALG